MFWQIDHNYECFLDYIKKVIYIRKKYCWYHENTTLISRNSKFFAVFDFVNSSDTMVKSSTFFDTLMLFQIHIILSLDLLNPTWKFSFDKRWKERLKASHFKKSSDQFQEYVYEENMLHNFAMACVLDNLGISDNLYNWLHEI